MNHFVIKYMIWMTK